MKELTRSFWPSFLPILDEEKEWGAFHESSGVSICEDAKNVYVEAALPGITPEEIEITYDKGILFIKADKKEEIEDKQKKYYRKAHHSFCYQVAVPGQFRDEPEASCKDGLLKVSFPKKELEGAPKKKIMIKKG